MKRRRLFGRIAAVVAVVALAPEVVKAEEAPPASDVSVQPWSAAVAHTNEAAMHTHTMATGSYSLDHDHGRWRYARCETCWSFVKHDTTQYDGQHHRGCYHATPTILNPYAALFLAEKIGPSIPDGIPAGTLASFTPGTVLPEGWRFYSTDGRARS